MLIIAFETLIKILIEWGRSANICGRYGDFKMGVFGLKMGVFAKFVQLYGENY